MRPRIIAAIFFLAFATVAFAHSQPANPSAVLTGTIRVTLLGTASGPPVRLIPAARRTYSDPLELGEDLMTIEIAGKVSPGHAGKREDMSHAQEATATKTDPPTPSSATELSPDQKAGIIEIISEARENGAMVAKRLQSNAKKFDEVVLADTIDPVLEKRCIDGITAAIYDSTQFRLQAATQVVHQLTAEQRRYLRAEMARPDSEKGILEAVPKVFHLKLKEKD
jgi:hypothetical protein